MPAKRTDLKRAFYAKVAAPDPRGCRLWLGTRTPFGYGHFLDADGRIKPAHRIAYRFAHGEIPKGMCVCHHCDVPGCVEVTHLFLGTKRENNADRDRKGRTPRGEQHGGAKLTADQVREIRQSTLPNTTLGRHYGVSDMLISLIRKRRVWAALS